MPNLPSKSEVEEAIELLRSFTKVNQEYLGKANDGAIDKKVEDALEVLYIVATAYTSGQLVEAMKEEEIEDIILSVLSKNKIPIIFTAELVYALSGKLGKVEDKQMSREEIVSIIIENSEGSYKTLGYIINEDRLADALLGHIGKPTSILDMIDFAYGKEKTLERGIKLLYHKELKTIIALKEKYNGLKIDSFVVKLREGKVKFPPKKKISDQEIDTFKEIYEGDIVKMHGYYGWKNKEIKWNEKYCCYQMGEKHAHGMGDGGGEPRLLTGQIEVIGNIYENPDLLEK